MELSHNKRLNYVAVLPTDYDPAQIYPVLIALPPGDQSPSMVSWGITRYWMNEGVRRDWITISPAAPIGRLFHQEMPFIPEFLDRIAHLYQPEGDKFHLAGISNGGCCAFHVALALPEYFHSLTVLPGIPPHKVDLSPLRHMPVTMYVGAEDISWLGPMQQTATRLAKLRIPVSLQVIPEEGHVIESLFKGTTLFDELDRIHMNMMLQRVL